MKGKENVTNMLFGKEKAHDYKAVRFQISTQPPPNSLW
jgi:hypothetical protein